MGKLSPFSIIYFAHALDLFRVLFTVQQTRFSWALTVRKEVLQKIRNGMPSCWRSPRKLQYQDFRVFGCQFDWFGFFI